MGEHYGRYGPVAERLARSGIQACGVDLRGHGRSEGTQGDALTYAEFLEDIAAARASLCDAGRPTFLYGHSLGGQLVVNYILQHGEEGLHGAILSAPWLALRLRPPRYKVVLARMALWFFPGFLQHTRLQRTNLSRDQDHLDILDPEGLRHDLMSARLYHYLVAGADQALAGASRFTLPFRIFHGSDDPVTSPEASAQFFQASPAEDKEFELLEGFLHEPHNDLGREEVLDKTIEWLLKRSSGQSVAV